MCYNGARTFGEYYVSKDPIHEVSDPKYSMDEVADSKICPQTCLGNQNPHASIGYLDPLDYKYPSVKLCRTSML